MYPENTLDAERTDRKATLVCSDPYNGTVRFHIYLIRYVLILSVFIPLCYCVLFAVVI